MQTEVVELIENLIKSKSVELEIHTRFIYARRDHANLSDFDSSANNPFIFLLEDFSIYNTYDLDKDLRISELEYSDLSLSIFIGFKSTPDKKIYNEINREEKESSKYSLNVKPCIKVLNDVFVSDNCGLKGAWTKTNSTPRYNYLDDNLDGVKFNGTLRVWH